MSCLNFVFLHPTLHHFISDLLSDHSSARFEVSYKVWDSSQFCIGFQAFSFFVLELVLAAMGLDLVSFSVPFLKQAPNMASICPLLLMLLTLHQFVQHINLTWFLSQGLSKWVLAELNNTVYPVYIFICPATVLHCTITWRQPGLSKGFVDF